MLFNAVNYLRSKKRGREATRNPFEGRISSNATSLGKKRLFSQRKKKRRGRRKRVVVNEAVARISLCERYLSQCFAVVRSFVMQSCSPNEPTRPCTLLSPFSSQLPTIFSVGASRLLPPDRKCEIYPPNRDLWYALTRYYLPNLIYTGIGN